MHRNALFDFPKNIFMLGWFGLNAVVFWKTYLYYRDSPKYFYLHEVLGRGLCIARAAANVINLNMGMLLLPMCRSSISLLRTFKCKVSMWTFRHFFDHCKAFHIVCAWIVTIASVLHFVSHAFNAYNFSDHYNSRYVGVNAASFPNESPLLIVCLSVPGVTGVFLLIVLCLIVSSAIARVRYVYYDCFWYTHRLFVVFYLLVLVHALRGILRGQNNLLKHTPGCMYNNLSIPWPEGEPAPEINLLDWHCDEDPTFERLGSSSWIWITPPLIIYICDATFRYFRGQHPVSIVTTVHHPCDVLELELRKDGFVCTPGQFVLLLCPAISTFEWHPFTISKCPSNKSGNFLIHVKAKGDWSACLKEYLIPDDIEKNRMPQLYMDGPFGSPLEYVLRYRVSLCVAGGIGISPFIANLQKWRHHSSEKPERIYLIWICHNVESFMCFVDLICDIFEQFWLDNKPDAIDLQLYVTSELDKCKQAPLPDRYHVLNKRLRFCRPDWQTIFARVTAAHRGIDIGVFTCGSKSLNRSVEGSCSNIHIGGVSYHCYHESF